MQSHSTHAWHHAVMVGLGLVGALQLQLSKLITSEGNAAQTRVVTGTDT